MSTIVSWLLPMVLAAAANMIDSWAQNATHVAGFVGTIAAVWLALRLHPNGVNGPPKNGLTVTKDPEPAGVSIEQDGPQPGPFDPGPGV